MGLRLVAQNGSLGTSTFAGSLFEVTFVQNPSLVHRQWQQDCDGRDSQQVRRHVQSPVER